MALFVFNFVWYFGQTHFSTHSQIFSCDFRSGFDRIHCVSVINYQNQLSTTMHPLLIFNCKSVLLFLFLAFFSSPSSSTVITWAASAGLWDTGLCALFSAISLFYAQLPTGVLNKCPHKAIASFSTVRAFSACIFHCFSLARRRKHHSAVRLHGAGAQHQRWLVDLQDRHHALRR